MLPQRKTLGDFLALWAKHEKLYCSIFREALQLLEFKAYKNENEIQNEDFFL